MNSTVTATVMRLLYRSGLRDVKERTSREDGPVRAVTRSRALFSAAALLFDDLAQDGRDYADQLTDPPKGT